MRPHAAVWSTLLVCSSMVLAASNHFPLDLAELDAIGINAEDLLVHLKHLADGNYVCGPRQMSEMKRHFIRNPSVTCNDGSKAGYYLRRSPSSSRWIVFLEGGWMCFDQGSCQGRWINTPHLMSSGHWAETRKGSGILSWNPDENPFIHDGNLVYVPYCSSDSWSGTYKAQAKGEFSFMGSLILQEVIRDLVEHHDMESASKLYLAGSSAGGTGVLLNLDRVAAQMSLLAPRVEVRGIADSGWFLDNKQYEHVKCSEVHSCAPTEAVMRGFKLWHAEVPDKCRGQYPDDQHWRCFFGYRIYSTLKTPVFVVQHLFDEAQITVNNVGPPVKKAQWQYIHNIGQDMKRTLTNVSALFAPACLSHIVLARSEWQRVSISGVTLPEALKCWEDGRQETNHYEVTHQKDRVADRFLHRLITGERTRRRDRLLSDDPEGNKSRKRQNRKRKRRDRKKKKGKRREVNENSSRHRLHSKSRHRGDTASDDVDDARRSRRSTLFFDHHDFHHMRLHENQCSHHRMDHCAWPQCNFSCPKIRNPFTGEEMDFIDLLMQFGLDLSSIAEALGMDLPTLQAMDHDVLLRLLVKNSR